MTDLTGRTIRGYEIRDKIGEGGYGAVYKAHQAAVGRDVAVKVILPEHAQRPEFAQRFETEARLVARLEHPHIVPLYDYWHDDDGAYLVMRWLYGSLRGALRRQGAWSLAQTARLLDQIAEALAVAHQAGVIHRDLKPDNILLDERGNAYLADFGIAKHLDSDMRVTGTDAIVGTPAYLAPEQIKSDPVTPQTDIYALGIMLYEILAGEHPFADTPPIMLVMKHLQEPLPSLGERRTDLPKAIDNIIQKATAKDVAMRYSDSPALAADFRAAANLTPGTAVEIMSVGARRAVPVQQDSTSIRKTPATPERRNRHHMLQNVRAFWIEGVLENSLHGAALIELGMKQTSGAIDHAWDTLLRMPGAPDQILPPGTRILELFDRLNGKLLILGDPGSGKTTTLLELARDLLYRADADEEHPIPVILNLSSWSESRKPLVEWLVDELSSKYQAPKKVAQEWVESDALLLLLDGLDEVTADQREACVQAINAYREEHGFVDVVVCSRSADYEALTNRLKLNGAIVIQPLGDSQVDRYLASLGVEMDSVRRMLTSDATLRELARSPLMLSILALAYRGVSEADLPKLDTPEAQRKHVFDVYVRRMFERRIGEKPYPQEQTIHYLSWLARKMQEHAQSVFHIEKMQPTWLTDTQRQRFYNGIRLIDLPIRAVLGGASSYFFVEPTLGIPGWLIGPLYGLAMVIAGWVWTGNQWKLLSIQSLVSLAIGLGWGLGVSLEFGPLKGVGFGFGTAAFALLVVIFLIRLAGTIGIQRNHIVSIEALHFSPAKINLWLGAIGIVFGVVGVIPFRLVFGLESLPFAHFALGLAGGGVVNALGALLISALTTGEVERRTQPNQGIWASLANATRMWFGFSLIMILFGLLGIAPVSTLGIGLALGIVLGITIGYTIAFVFGGYTVIQHIALRRVLHSDGTIPQNYARFLDYAASLIFLRKVGGGYIFIHRYLLEHFASLEA